MSAYLLGIDQSTQGTKGLLFDSRGTVIGRADLPHRQIVDEKGWVEHDPEEIYANTVQVVRNLIKNTGISSEEIAAIGISNQRETAVAWDRVTGKPVCHAIVWQCARGEGICRRLEQPEVCELIKHHTGLQLSPYFSAAKLAWILEHVPEAGRLAEEGRLCCGTMDSWLVYHMTGGREFRTDYSNASRTQLFNIHTLSWDPEICRIFGIPMECLAEVTDSDGLFGTTDLEGTFPRQIPVHAVMGDSHGALFGQECTRKGMVKATYGTGSSIMMNIGETPVISKSLVTSLAWSMGGKVNYVLEGNINYTGAVISWLKDDLQLIGSAQETEALAKAANPEDQTYLVPAFSGLGAPYWASRATAMITGMSRTTGKAELVKAALDSIAYQITDVVKAMESESGIQVRELRVDGGPTKNGYLMQFQSDIAGIPLQIPSAEELSGIGTAYAAGMGAGIYGREVFDNIKRTCFSPDMPFEVQSRRYEGWKKAIGQVLA